MTSRSNKQRSGKPRSNPRQRAARRHGGKRAGAGRPARRGFTIDQAEVDFLTSDAPPDYIEAPAQRHARLAISTLVKKMLGSKNEAARVAAANEILDRGYGKPAVDLGGDAMLPFAMKPSQPTVSDAMRAEARKHARLAIEILRLVVEIGRSESACVRAAKSLLDRALGAVGTAKVPPEMREGSQGKKEIAQRAAEEAATGRYATPPPPKFLN